MAKTSRLIELKVSIGLSGDQECSIREPRWARFKEIARDIALLWGNDDERTEVVLVTNTTDDPQMLNPYSTVEDEIGTDHRDEPLRITAIFQQTSHWAHMTQGPVTVPCQCRVLKSRLHCGTWITGPDVIFNENCRTPIFREGKITSLADVWFSLTRTATPRDILLNFSDRLSIVDITKVMLWDCKECGKKLWCSQGCIPFEEHGSEKKEETWHVSLRKYARCPQCVGTLV
jgi:hypothetical protein